MGKHIFITGYYGFGNNGDEAILTAIVAHLRAADPALRITTTSAEPAQTASTFGVEAILWSDMLAMLEAVRSADLILIGGGGIFHDYWGFNPQAFLTDNQWGIGFYTAPAVLGSLYGKPVMLYAVGVGPLLSDQGRRFTKVACDAAQKITVRDAGSKALLETLGVDGRKVEVTADPVFGFPLQELKAKSTPGKIGVALRHWDVGVHPSFVEAEIAQALDLFLRNNPNEIEFIPFQLLTNREDDLAVAHRVHGLMQQKDRATVLDQPLSPAALLERMSSYDLVVGMRLHSVIFGLLAGVPVVALSYDPKVEQVMAQMGLQAFSLDVHSIEAAGLAARMQESLEDGPVSRERTQSLRELAVRNAAIALEILQHPEPQPIGRDALALIRRGVEAQLGDTDKFRKESQRLLKEAEFYINELSHAKAALAERETILVAQRNEYAARVEAQETVYSSRVKELEQAKTKLEEECDGLKTRVRDLASELSQVSDANRSLEQSLESIRANFTRAETQLQNIEAKLRTGEEIRSKAVKALDRFTDKFQETNILYRNQKAWQVMLLLRKAYTLLFRHGTGEFLQWVVSWPFAGFGSLAEYDLQFPQVWNYMPEALEKPLLTDVSVQDVPTADVKESAPRTVAELLPQQKYDVVIMAIFDFDFRFQRPQQIAAQFARTGHRVFWVSPGRFLPPGDTKPYEAIPLRENMWEVHLRGTRPEMYTGSLPPETAQSIHASLKELYKDHGIAESCAILQFPFWRQVGLNLRSEFGARVVYDCMDDWQNWTAEPRISDWNLEQERLLTREADVLVVTSQEFLERHQANGLHPVLARNAADFDFFATPRANDLIKDKSKPIVGYYGAIADWFDLDLVTRLAESRPQYNFVLIGQVHGVDTSKLAALPNVSMPGEKNYREIPLYLSHFDVCLIPFVLNKLTKGVDPVKMYEYFSQGKPVVATEMAELAQSTDLLYIGRTFEEFAANVDRAIAEQDPEVRRRRIEYARSNTWAARVDTIDAAVQKSFPKVSILIVTYNGEEFLEPCFESIERNTAWPNYEVIVVDNNSNAATRQILSKYAGRDFHVEFLNRNSGFAGGNNIAARKATGDYLVFLNPDTIVPAGWLGRLVLHCQRDRSVGAVAAVTNFSGNESKINIDYENVLEMQRFALELAKKKHGEAVDIAVAALYCVVVPRTVWEKTGELDEQFLVGMFEDDDFSFRVRRAGYRVIAADDTFIHHFGNGSFAKIPSEESLRIFEQNKKIFEAKWQTAWQPHKLRPGVRPPFEEVRDSVADFLRVEKVTAAGDRRKLKLQKLHPGFCTTRQGFNIQSDGQSALVVECEHATPGTVIVWGGTMLTTSYGNPALLSALVPADLYASAGSVEVYLLNDFGQSNRLEFVVESPKASLVIA